MIRRSIPDGSAARFCEAVIGLGLLLFGATVMLGWLMQWPRVVRLDTTTQVVVFNAALLFLLGGAAQLAGIMRAGSTLPTALGFVISGVAGVALLQDFVPFNLGVSWSALHTWLPKSWSRLPGAMNPNPAISFLCCGLALALMDRVDRPGAANLIRAFIGIAIGLPVLDLIGKLTHLDLLYPGYMNWRMALGTAYMMLALAAGTWFAWRRTTWVQAQAPMPADSKIAYLSAWILTGLTLAAGVSTFTLLQTRVEESFGQSQLDMLKTRTAVYELLINGKLSNMDSIASRPALQKQLRNLALDAHDATSDAAAREILQSFLPLGFSSIVVRRPDGQELFRVGEQAADPELAVPLHVSAPAALLLLKGRYFLRSERLISDSAGVLGRVEVEQPLLLLSRFASKVEQQGETGEMGLCSRAGEHLRCFPLRLKPEVFDILPRNIVGDPFPMAMALAGKTGVIKTFDYRQKQVVAAYGPIGATGLGLVMKMDLVELYAPIREHLPAIAWLLLLFVALGALAIQFQVTPLARRLLRTEQQARAYNSALLEKAADLEASEKRLRVLGDNIPALIAYTNAEQRFSFGNYKYEEAYGVLHREIKGKATREVLGEDVYAQSEPYILAALAGTPAQFERTVERGNTVRCERVSYIPDVNDDGRVAGFFSLAEDITELKQIQMTLAESQNRLRTITDNVPALICYIDKERRFQFNNQTYAEWLNRPLSEITGRLVREVHQDETFRNVEAHIEQAFAGQRASFQAELNLGGKPRFFRGAYIPHFDDDGKVIGVYGLTNDITSLKRVESQLTLLAKFDALTGLANRHHFNEKLAEAIARSGRNGSTMALMFLDIDRFKDINDELSHRGGDQVLKQFSRRLKSCIRQTDTVARLAGDEFVIILEGLHAADEVRTVAGKIIQVMEPDFDALGTARKVTTSIGIAIRRDGETDAAALLHRADEALYLAKAAGRNTFHLGA